MPVPASVPAPPAGPSISVTGLSRAARRRHLDGLEAHPAAAAVKGLEKGRFHEVLDRICAAQASNTTYAAAYSDYLANIGTTPITLVSMKSYLVDYTLNRQLKASSLPSRVAGIKAVACVQRTWAVSDDEYTALCRAIVALQKELPTTRDAAPAVRFDRAMRAAVAAIAGIPASAPAAPSSAAPRAGGGSAAAAVAPAPLPSPHHPLARRQAMAIACASHNGMTRPGDLLNGAARLKDVKEQRQDLLGSGVIDIYAVDIVQSKANKRSADPELAFIYDELAVRVVRAYLADLRAACPALPPDAPLFPFIDFRSGAVDLTRTVSPDMAKRRISTLLGQHGIVIPGFSMHGFRRGGRTDLLAKNVPRHIVDKLGRWTSSAGDLYDERNGIDVIGASATLVDMCTGAAASAAEHRPAGSRAKRAR